MTYYTLTVGRAGRPGQGILILHLPHTRSGDRFRVMWVWNQTSCSTGLYDIYLTKAMKGVMMESTKVVRDYEPEAIDERWATVLEQRVHDAWEVLKLGLDGVVQPRSTMLRAATILRPYRGEKLGEMLKVSFPIMSPTMQSLKTTLTQPITICRCGELIDQVSSEWLHEAWRDNCYNAIPALHIIAVDVHQLGSAPHDTQERRIYRAFLQNTPEAAWCRHCHRFCSCQLDICHQCGKKIGS